MRSDGHLGRSCVRPPGRFRYGAQQIIPVGVHKPVLPNQVRRPVQLGVNPFVLMPGEAMSMYHWEGDKEAFLVVSGEAVLSVEGDERPLRTWDFFHCPPGTKHVIIGAGNGPCAVIAVGSRRHDELGFPADEVARRYGASVEDDTTDGGVAYANVPPRRPSRYREGWLP